ncbi:DEAD/DEAH box helicase [Aquibacillus kalidii]|uniref:DEAD/DEAH box helicase n=1 Tax=Aquibacillus kalidii TaxID=2762597 RepID=UPI00164410CA|nr:DEAD/DEAH box helicase family protein [Aquibacillus kalidii]
MLNIASSLKSYFTPSYSWVPSSNTKQDDSIYSKQFAGKLLLRQEIPLDDPTLNELLHNNLFTTLDSIEKYIWGHRCRRCGNKKKHLFANIPCARCNHTHLYCRKCIEMGRVLECEPLYYWTGSSPTWLEQEEPCGWSGELTRHQQVASDRIKEMMIKGNSELLCWAVCGAGKTEMLFDGISAAIKLGKRVCLATPRADVVRELLPRFRIAFPNTEIEALYGGSEEKQGAAQLIIATTHQLLRFAHAFDVMIIDEIDAFPFHADSSLPFAAKRAVKPSAATIYLTATPRKQQKRRIEAKTLPTVFVPVRFHGHPLPIPKLQMSFTLNKSLNANLPPTSFMKWYQHYRINPNRQLLIFVAKIELAEPLVESLISLHIASGKDEITSVHAADPDREIKVQQFREQKLKLLVTTTILERGVTFPSVDVVVFDAGHQVFDEAALVQIAGRAGRSPDDPTGEVIFYHSGKTDAMVEAVHSIIRMNRKGRRL